MTKIELLYPIDPTPRPVSVGDFLQHPMHGLFIVAKPNWFSTEKVGLISIRSGAAYGPPINPVSCTKLTGEEAKVLLQGNFSEWVRLSHEEAAAYIGVPF